VLAAACGISAGSVRADALPKPTQITLCVTPRLTCKRNASRVLRATLLRDDDFAATTAALDHADMRADALDERGHV